MAYFIFRKVPESETATIASTIDPVTSRSGSNISSSGIAFPLDVCFTPEYNTDMFNRNAYQANAFNYNSIDNFDNLPLIRTEAYANTPIHYYIYSSADSSSSRRQLGYFLKVTNTTTAQLLQAIRRREIRSQWDRSLEYPGESDSSIDTPQSLKIAALKADSDEVNIFKLQTIHEIGIRRSSNLRHIERIINEETRVLSVSGKTTFVTCAFLSKELLTQDKMQQEHSCTAKYYNRCTSVYAVDDASTAMYTLIDQVVPISSIDRLDASEFDILGLPAAFTKLKYLADSLNQNFSVSASEFAKLANIVPVDSNRLDSALADTCIQNSVSAWIPEDKDKQNCYVETVISDYTITGDTSSVDEEVPIFTEYEDEVIDLDDEGEGGWFDDDEWDDDLRR